MRPDLQIERESAPGRVALVNGLLVLVILMVVLQLWLVTVALDLYFVGDAPGVTVAAAVSAVAFLASLGALLVSRR